MSDILEFDTKADAQSLYDIINNKLRELTGESQFLWSPIRQPDKIDYNFWLVVDPRNAYSLYDSELTAVIDGSGIEFRRKTLPYEYDYTQEDIDFYGQKLGYN
jgi:hypothetical protein